MTTLGFTGTRTLDTVKLQAEMDMARLIDDRRFTHFVSGACIGFDTYAGLLAVRMRPDATHLVIVPADRSRVSGWWLAFPHVLVQKMAAGSSYADRNERIVAICDFLVALPEHDEDHPRSARSGTWQTVRMARRADRGIVTLPPTAD